MGMLMLRYFINGMKKLISYPFSILYYLFFGLSLLVFHPIQWLTLKIGGYNAHRKSVALLNLCLTKCIFFIGGRVKFNNPNHIPKDKPLIIVANHQSMYDIPPIIWYMRKYHPKFISSKCELYSTLKKSPKWFVRSEIFRLANVLYFH